MTLKVVLRPVRWVLEGGFPDHPPDQQARSFTLKGVWLPDLQIRSLILEGSPKPKSKGDPILFFMVCLLRTE